MDLYEYQAKSLFRKHEVPVLRGMVVTTAQAAHEAYQELNSSLVVVKAQVKTGGRGKAGGVKLARSAAEAENQASNILGMNIKGHTVNRVFVTSGVDITAEYYFSILLDRTNRQNLAMFSAQGGMEIERLAKENPEALVKMPIPADGMDQGLACEIVKQAGLDSATAAKVVPVMLKLWETYVAEDATLVEVNPLVQTPTGDIIALDAKMTLDDNARYRHPEHQELVDQKIADQRELKAQEAGLNYVRLDGQVGIVGNGAGLVMSTLDVVAYAGEKYGTRPANFLDIGGGASAEVMAKGLEVILTDPQVKSCLVNVFGGITACDQVAEGILGALEILDDRANKPLVVRLDGNRVEEGRAILAAANHPLITMMETMDEAADKAAELAAK